MGARKHHKDVEQYYNLDFDYEDLRKNYWFNETCQNSVPQAIFCFLISTDFEDCLRTTISIGGDCDTTAAISCAIAEAYYKTTKDYAEELKERLPDDLTLVTNVPVPWINNPPSTAVWPAVINPAFTKPIKAINKPKNV